MNIYNYHPSTGELVGVSKADSDPLIPDRWLVPAFSTAIAPTECSENEVAIFTNGLWAVSLDYRGVDYWDNDGVKHTVEILGEGIPKGSILTPPPTVEQKQAAIVKDGAWEVVPNFVGTEYWDADGTKHTITEVGKELPEGALLEEPDIPPTLEEQTALANSECTRRINEHWNQVGQINASLGIYGEEDRAACAAWISDNRTALIEVLGRDDLFEIDVIADKYWPIFEGSN